MTDEELALFDEMLSEQFGMSFPPHRKEILESRLLPRLRERNLATFMDYYYALQFSRNGAHGSETEALVRAITNNETYFLRETHQFDSLVAEIADWRRRNTDSAEPFRLLSAGCSSGEEPLSIGIHLREHRASFWSQNFTIDAFDLDPERIALARRGEYGRSSLRVLSEEQVTRYFAPIDSERWALKPAWKQEVRFNLGNLLDPVAYGVPGRYDAIFCRNVLIYFAEEPLLRAVRNFARALKLGGVLFLGHSESIIGMVRSLEAVRLGNCIVYRRVE
jgi:chemotaxis protein methyltransferase CheR